MTRDGERYQVRKTPQGISAEIRQAQRGTDADRRRYRGTLMFVTLPWIVRAPLWRVMMAHPWGTKRFGARSRSARWGCSAAALAGASRSRRRR
jgi:hypothetical protein